MFLTIGAASLACTWHDHASLVVSCFKLTLSLALRAHQVTNQAFELVRRSRLRTMHSSSCTSPDLIYTAIDRVMVLGNQQFGDGDDLLHKASRQHENVHHSLSRNGSSGHLLAMSVASSHFERWHGI
ncbi:hypothetical protein C8Q74DRAFT_806646 [Fomes fomentarius]|nr:hypothetical protein C8Q74DRAFT_806646 [Fomes fomentarius]